MKSIPDEIKELKKQPIKKAIDKRLKEFRSLSKKGNNDWFSELCFCILTANSKAQTAINIQKTCGAKGFLTYRQSKLADIITDHKHRFHNNKAKFIVEARKFKNIKDRLKGMDEKEKREWIAKNIKGLGYKEASHFLRNTGHFNLAIIDRHILRKLSNNGLIELPKTVTQPKYLKIEQILAKICDKSGMSQAELDLYLWYAQTEKVLK